MVSSRGHSGTSRSGATWGSSLPFLPDKERKLCAHPRLEIYQQDQIYFMCPLARQGDFYVPEVKETERKSRGPAEASDTQVDDTGTEGGERGRPAWSPLSRRVGRGQGGPSLAGPHCGCPVSTPGPTGSYLFPDACVHVGVGSYMLLLATQVEDSARIPFGGSRSTLGDTDHRQLGARGGWEPRLLRKGITWVGSSGSKIGTGSGR